VGETGWILPATAMVKQLINSVIDGKYKILSLLAEGGSGSVYKAQQPDLGRFVAIKTMHDLNALDPDSRHRFEREGALLARLAHENIVKTYAIGFLDESSLYLALEYLEGETLAALLQKNGAISEPRLLKIAIQLCKAVEFAHRQGIIHRDLKPQNIMVLNFPDRELVKVLDFGLSKLVCPDARELQKLTRTGTLIGTVHYMSPEMCAGKQADFRSDIYSLGCVLYECALGVPPFQADNPLRIMHKHAHEYPSILLKSALSPFEQVIFKCLQKDPANRFQSASDLCLALEQIADGHTVELSLAGMHQGMVGGASKARAWTIWLLLLFLFSVSGLAFIFTKHHLSQEKVQNKPKIALKADSERRLERDLKGSLARAERNFAPDSLEIEERLNKLGLYYMKENRLAEAEPLLKRSLAIAEKEFGPKDPILFWRLLYLADCLKNQSRFAEASPLYERALSVRKWEEGLMDVDRDLQRALSGKKKGEGESLDPQRELILRSLAECDAKQKQCSGAKKP
jgi:eukaryotic-like serine/threonine-protein kinase